FTSTLTPGSVGSGAVGSARDAVGWLAVSSAEAGVGLVRGLSGRLDSGFSTAGRVLGRDIGHAWGRLLLAAVEESCKPSDRDRSHRPVEDVDRDRVRALGADRLAHLDADGNYPARSDVHV